MTAITECLSVKCMHIICTKIDFQTHNFPVLIISLFIYEIILMRNKNYLFISLKLRWSFAYKLDICCFKYIFVLRTIKHIHLYINIFIFCYKSVFFMAHLSIKCMTCAYSLQLKTQS